MSIYWCLTHNSNAEGPVARCFYALFAEATDRCELAEAEIRLTDDPEPKYETGKLPTIEEWVNRQGQW